MSEGCSSEQNRVRSNSHRWAAGLRSFPFRALRANRSCCHGNAFITHTGLFSATHHINTLPLDAPENCKKGLNYLYRHTAVRIGSERTDQNQNRQTQRTELWALRDSTSCLLSEYFVLDPEPVRPGWVGPSALICSHRTTGTDFHSVWLPVWADRSRKRKRSCKNQILTKWRGEYADLWPPSPSWYQSTMATIQSRQCAALRSV